MKIKLEVYLKQSRFFVIGFLLVLLIGLSGALQAESPGLRLEEITKKIDRNNRKINIKNKKKQKEKKQLIKLNKEIKLTKVRLEKNKKALKKAIQNENELKDNIKVLNKEFEFKKSKFKKRVKSIHESQNIQSLNWLFVSETWDVNSLDQHYFNIILKKDIRLIEKIKKQQTQLNLKRERWKEEKKKVSYLKELIQKKEKGLVKRQKSKRKILKTLSQQIAIIEKQNRELEQSSSKIAQMIRKGKTKGYLGTGRMKRPCKGWVSSRYGYRKHPIFKRRIKHNGIDLAAPKGRKIRAADTGIVIFSGKAKRYKGYGKVTVIDHGRRKKDKKRLSTVYAHQSRILVKEGDLVKKGDLIGFVGSTGYTTGPHLHFEVRLDGIPTNPAKFVKF